jgi:hypothetical protein
MGSAFAGAARIDPPLFDGRVAGWFCDGAANGFQLPVEAFKTIKDLRADIENIDTGGPDGCAAFLNSSAYAFAVASAGASTFRVRDPFGGSDSDASPDADAGAGHCCHGARERLRLGFFDPIFGNSGAVPEPPIPALLMVGFAWIGLAAYARAIRNRAAMAATGR